MISSQENSSYLKFIFSEDLYLVNEVLPVSISESAPKPAIDKLQASSAQKIYKIGIVAAQSDIEKYKEFLTKLLGAIKIQWNDASMIGDTISSVENYQSILVFGVSNYDKIPVQSAVTPNEPIEEGNCKIIFTYSLPELDNNNARKGTLWGAMKKAYSI